MRNFASCLLLLVITNVIAQTNDTPLSAYEWKKNKTILHDGYVVLKSGKRMEGQISLVGAPGQITGIFYKSGDKEVNFPPASLTSFGLTGVIENLNAAGSSNNINTQARSESPEAWYDWHNTGTIIMGKVITATRSRPGYVVLKNGKRYEGDLVASRKGDDLRDIKISTPQGNEKFDADEISSYGLTVNEQGAGQLKLEDNFRNALPGYMITNAGRLDGEIKALSNTSLIFKGTDNTFKEYNVNEVKAYYVRKKDQETGFVSMDGGFQETKFNGTIFLVYLNPKPTTINQGATSRARTLAGLAGQGIAMGLEEKNKTSASDKRSFDSLLMNSSDEQLMKYKDALQQTLDALNNNSSSINSVPQSLGFADIDVAQDLKKQVGSRLASVTAVLAGRQASSSIVIMNEEWIVLNRKTSETLIVYKNDYKKQVEVLLMGCDQFIMLDKGKQNDLRKFDSMAEAFKLLDGCY